MEPPGGSSLISLHPSHTLSFKLEKNKSPRTILKVTNTSNSKVLFKVKTTQPTWYYVRPNQQVLDVGQSEEVVILLVENECNRFLKQAAANAAEKLDKHRFLVQSKIVEDKDFAIIQELSSAQRSEEFAKIWDGPGDSKKNIKLKVDFVYPSDLSDYAPPTAPATGEEATGGEAVRKALARVPETHASSSSTGEDNFEPGSYQFADTGGSSSSGGGTSLDVELQSLRKKYDAVVDYTVRLTVERDNIIAQLDSAQRELVKEKAKRKSTGADGANAGSESAPLLMKPEKKSGDKGFSLFMVILAALLSFLIGKYLSS